MDYQIIITKSVIGICECNNNYISLSFDLLFSLFVSVRKSQNISNKQMLLALFVHYLLIIKNFLIK